jgi:hypothetical protein
MYRFVLCYITSRRPWLHRDEHSTQGPIDLNESISVAKLDEGRTQWFVIVKEVVLLYNLQFFAWLSGHISLAHSQWSRGGIIALGMLYYIEVWQTANDSSMSWNIEVFDMPGLATAVIRMIMSGSSLRCDELWGFFPTCLPLLFTQANFDSPPKISTTQHYS